MRRHHARLAAVSALAAATAVFCGSAFAGGGHGSSGNAPGHESARPQQTQQTESRQQGGSQQEVGVKPSSTTKHWTHTTVGGAPDVSKRYGNGPTAAEIAKSRGAPADQPLTGPGNSQPHKTTDCGHGDNRSGGVDVHAIKSYSTSCGTTAGSTVQPTHPVETQPVTTTPQRPEQKITLCHATGAATHPYVEITVDEHALREGHTTAKGDIIPAPAGGCPTAAGTSPVVPTVSFCANGTLMTKPADEVVASYLAGPDIVPPFTYNGRTYSYDWPSGEAVFDDHCSAVAAVAPPTTAAAAPTTATVTVTTATTATTTTPTTAAGVAGTTTTPPSAPAAATTTAAGSVLGARTTLAPKHQGHGGVLGTVTHVAGGTLPFTGFPVWLATLVAFASILAGVALRRRTLGARR